MLIIKISNNVSNNILNPLRVVKLRILSVVMASVPLTAFREVTLEDSSGWKFGINGRIPVFALVSENEDAFRITT